MKKILVTLAFLSLGIIAVNVEATAQQSPAAAQNPNGPQFKFKGSETHDFGEIVEREDPYEHKFEFTNTGKSALIIQNVTASCGCTTPDWPKQPIAPGKTGVITVKYNSKGRVAPFNKDIFIKSNATPEPYTIRIKGTVKSPDAKKG
jgi:hypothetical protein